MKILKRVTSFVGVVVLAASSLLASDAMAQGIGTTITVDNSVPVCVDDRPSSLTLNNGAASASFFTLSGTGTTFPAKVSIPGFITMNLYVNECLVDGWGVTAAMTAFHNGSHSVSPVGTLQMYANTSAYSRPVRPNPPYVPYTLENQVPNTTGLPTVDNNFGGAVIFTSEGEDYFVASQPVSTGIVPTAGSEAPTGEMQQGIKMRLSNVPSTTPAGSYEADLIFTFTPGGL